MPPDWTGVPLSDRRGKRERRRGECRLLALLLLMPQGGFAAGEQGGGGDGWAPPAVARAVALGDLHAVPVHHTAEVSDRRLLHAVETCFPSCPCGLLSCGPLRGAEDGAAAMATTAVRTRRCPATQSRICRACCLSSGVSRNSSAPCHTKTS